MGNYAIILTPIGIKAQTHRISSTMWSSRIESYKYDVNYVLNVNKASVVHACLLKQNKKYCSITVPLCCYNIYIFEVYTASQWLFKVLNSISETKCDKKIEWCFVEDQDTMQPHGI